MSKWNVYEDEFWLVGFGRNKKGFPLYINVDLMSLTTFV
jgi:hypothetical protein